MNGKDNASANLFKSAKNQISWRAIFWILIEHLLHQRFQLKAINRESIELSTYRSRNIVQFPSVKVSALNGQMNRIAFQPNGIKRTFEINQRVQNASQRPNICSSSDTLTHRDSQEFWRSIRECAP